MSAFGIAQGLRWRSLDDETAVYLPDRSETHLLDGAGGMLVETLAATGEACSIDDLARRLAVDSPGAEPVAVYRQALAPLLAELVRVGVLTEQAC